MVLCSTWVIFYATLLVLGKINAFLWHFLKTQESMTSTIWTPTTIIYLQLATVFGFYGFHHRLTTIEFFLSYICYCKPTYKDGTFVPFNKIITRKEIARLFLDNIYQYNYGLSDDIFSNQGSQFVFKFWKLFQFLRNLNEALLVALFSQI